MSIRNHWRQFRPRNVIRMVSPKRAQTEFWRAAREQVHQLFPGRQIRDDAMERAIQSARDRATHENDAVLWCVALILQAPRAAVAQEQMDKHPHGYRAKQERLFELIDFNDTYVSTVLSMPEGEIPSFADEAKKAMDEFCKQLRSRCFSNEQFEAITHGLSREIAVYRGAAREGYAVRMTNRVDDAFGIDMVVTDRETGQSINIDVKTHSAFYYRLKDLMREGRMTTEDAATAEDVGYAWIVNGDETRQERIVLFRLDQQTYGNIQHFTLESTTVLGQKLAEILQTVPVSNDAAILE